MEALAISVALLGGGLLGLGCARATVWLNPWLGGAAGFGCSVLGFAVLAGHFSTIPEGSIPGMLLGITLLQFGIVISGCHMSLLEAREHSPLWSLVAPVIGGVVLPERPRFPSTLVGSFAGHILATMRWKVLIVGGGAAPAGIANALADTNTDLAMLAPGRAGRGGDSVKPEVTATRASSSQTRTSRRRFGASTGAFQPVIGPRATTGPRMRNSGWNASFPMRRLSPGG